MPTPEPQSPDFGLRQTPCAAQIGNALLQMPEESFPLPGPVLSLPKSSGLSVDFVEKTVILRRWSKASVSWLVLDLANSQLCLLASKG